MIRRSLVLTLSCLLSLMLLLSGCGINGGRTQADVSLAPGSSSETDSGGSTGSDSSGSDSNSSHGSANGKIEALNLSGPGNTAANHLHDGIAAEYEGFVYYVDSMYQGSLWKMPVGGGMSQLLQVGSFFDVNVSGGVIFFLGDMPDADSDYSDTSGVFMLNTDGSDIRLVKEGYYAQLVLYNDYLYLVDYADYGLYRMKYDGSEETLLLENVYDDFAVYEDSIYLLRESDEYVTNIFKMPLTGGEPEIIVEDIFGGAMDIASGGIYYIARDNTSNMYRYDIASGEVSVFFSDWVDYINTDGENVYFYWGGVMQDDSDQGVYRAMPDGSDVTMLLHTPEQVFELNIAGGKMFWYSNGEQHLLYIMNLDGSDMQYVEQAPE